MTDGNGSTHGRAERDPRDAGRRVGGRGSRTRDRGPTPEQVRQQAMRVLEGMPPHATEIEACLLGAVMLDYRVMGDIVGILKGPDDFWRPAHATIYHLMVELYEREHAVDVVKLYQALVDRRLLESVGGGDYLHTLASAAPAASLAPEWARIVRSKAVLRELVDAAGLILLEAAAPDRPVQEILQGAEQAIFRIAQQSEQSSAESVAELIQEVLRQVEANEGRHVTGVATGYHELDELTSGLQAGELIVLAARPSMGKTAFALNLAENIAMAGTPVAIFSLEMSKQQLVQRLVCARSGVDSHRFRRGMLAADDYQRLLAACGELTEAPILIDDTPGLSLLQLRSKARRMRERLGLRCVVIDYLQLMSAGGRTESRQVEVSEISRGVKAMARELGVPVVCLSQLNRAAEQREGHRPRMSDLRESGSIEQDADVVAMLHREEYYHQSDPHWAINNPDKVGVAELIIAKQRNGPTGTVKLAWDSGSTRFRNLSFQRAPADLAAVRGGAARDRDPGAPRAAFQQGRASGPVENFRDGGGPIDDHELPA